MDKVETIVGRCPICATDSTGKKVDCCECGYVFPACLVIPYDTEWSFETHPPAVLREYQGLRLMGKFTGHNPERLKELFHVRYLSLSRYPRITFDWLTDFDALKSLELDLVGLEELAGVEKMKSLSLLTLTECRKLHDLSALRVGPRLRGLQIALCARLVDFDAVSAQSELILVELEGKKVESLAFLRPLSRLRALSLNAKVTSGGLQPLYTLNIERLTLVAGSVRKPEIEAFRKARPSCHVQVL